jgi:Leucine-rich repeat (LRR) protein
LDLRHNGLEELPADITDLENIRALQLWGNKLSTLPHQIGNLHSLKELYLNNNRLISLPQSITKLNLSYFDISFNYIRDSEASVDTWIKSYNKNYRAEQFEKKGGFHYL